MKKNVFKKTEEKGFHEKRGKMFSRKIFFYLHNVHRKIPYRFLGKEKRMNRKTVTLKIVNVVVTVMNNLQFK